jgi:hypothetical protein
MSRIRLKKICTHIIRPTADGHRRKTIAAASARNIKDGLYYVQTLVIALAERLLNRDEYTLHCSQWYKSGKLVR